ncbi:MAG: site-specific integrase [archaeon]
MMSAKAKIEACVKDKRWTKEQLDIVKRWTKHMRTYTHDKNIISYVYTVRKWAVYIDKPFDKATTEEFTEFLQLIDSNQEINDVRFQKVSHRSRTIYKWRIKSLYKWMYKHTDIEIPLRLAYGIETSKKRPSISDEARAEGRCKAFLTNTILLKANSMEKHLTQEELKRKYPEKILGEENLETLNELYNYKITSGKVTSHQGFYGCLWYVKKLGLFLDKKGLRYKEATKEDIRDFLAEHLEETKEFLRKRGKSCDNIKPNSTRKKTLLDFYRFIYGMFGDEHPRLYPECVSWLYTRKKKNEDRILKEILTDEEMKLLVEKTPLARDKAFLACLVDCSARKGELKDMNLEDVKVYEIPNKDSRYQQTIATIVLRGKTGERTNQLYFSVPYLRTWLALHPDKNNPKAPLFCSILPNRMGQRISGMGLNKIVQRATRCADINKHVYPHLFRHTNLTRMAKILSEQELKIHAGWSPTSNMAQVYVHLSQQDVANKILASYGIVKEESKKSGTILDVQVCPNVHCSYSNTGDAQFCQKCGYPLSMETAISLRKIKEKEESLHKDIMSKTISDVQIDKTSDLKEAMYQILKSDPEMIKKLKEIVKQVE